MSSKVIDAITEEFPELGRNLAIIDVSGRARKISVQLKTVEVEAHKIERHETLEVLNELQGIISNLSTAIKKRDG